jgi:tetratricopeptide (TPR) repeat protein
MPRPDFFTNVDALVSASGTGPLPPVGTARAHAALDKYILQTRAFRDIPGVVSDEALYLKARLLDRQGKYPEALAGYEELRAKTPPSAFADSARIRAGIDHSRLTNAVDAVECLSGIEPPEEDEALLSDMLFALGDAYVRLENWDSALMTYLSLVVFHPYFANNEARALTRTLPCYAALGEWESLYRAIQDITAAAPGTPAATYAATFAKTHAKQLGAVGEFVDGARVVEDTPATAIEGTTASTNAPAHTQFNAPPGDDATASPSSVEYPDELL